ncbi:hypothetical protein CkaCkLH20_06118 [Colletotrichum karsti]|uniref:Uncharacterized protein n=1 Tax=Colletotrichum karsti TaxID=1095194 RepID=A0A9P6ICL7_9PEZI|nr:uncharacterized protein CkaCkLH20_06118 [Colletotrichum karsti]KAF9876175.1 hypothetical protein CkaCkLH20_06118 [Colletotrichum karsti]
MPSLDTQVLSSRQDISTLDDIITRDLSSTKCLGTYKTMASPTPSSPAAAAPTTPPPPPAEAPKTLNPNVFRPATPPSHHHSDDGRGPKRAVSFIFPTVIVLRVVAIALAITLIVLEFERTGRYHGIGPFPVVLAFFQLFWLVFAVLRDLGRGGSGGRNKGFTVDLGFVKCIFGRRGHEDEDAGEMLLGWVPGDSGKKLKKAVLFTTATDLVFATITFTVGMVVKGGWHWSWGSGIYVVAFVIAGLEIIIAFAQHFTILKRARIQISYDEDESEDGLGSHKYRIRLPQSPERGQAPISVYAHTAI